MNSHAFHSGLRTSAGRRSASRPAFTLLEMLVTITVLALTAAMVAPMFSDDGRLRVIAAASILSSDIELAQVMTISFPTDPVEVRFDTALQRYWLAYAADPDTPLVRIDNGEPYLVTLGQGRASSAAGVSMTLDQVTNDMLAFESSGGLTDFATTPRIQLGMSGNAITLTVAPMTGTVIENDGPIETPKEESK